MKKYIITLLTSGLLLTGCGEDFLEVVPETQLSSATFFKTQSDFEQAVNAAYVPLRTITNDRSWLLGEMHSDNTYYARNILFGATEQQEDIADFAVPEANGLTSNTHVLNQYRQDYLIISRTNQILALIDDVDFDAAAKANVKGQALFLRAYAYFELVRYFGSVPLHLTPVATREEAALPLATEEELFAQIISDLTAAVPLLPEKSQQELGRASAGAARMLLANVYINRKNWSEAESLLKAIVNSGEYGLIENYEDVFPGNAANKNNLESIFEVQFLEGAAGLNGSFIYNFMPRPISASELQPITGTSNPQNIDGEGNNIPTPDIIQAYEEGDLRKDVSIGYVELSGSFRDDKVYPYIKKHAKPHSLHGNHGTNWIIYRYAETLLFLAEALNEQGKTSEAAGYLNMVRNRADLDDTSASGQAELREAIFRERRVELAFENKRWFDIARTDRIQEIIVPYGQRIIANPLDYYYPPVAGAVPRSNAFTNLSKFYPLPAAESDLSPYF
ncbi:RagB/SusD family nutrient uptake outer membrane protein [Algoriphagus sp. CAU 1675]|uniref:RagB/SusD family nutrient uptake outer membrane protein n=1 Tax=Algoriphagus sp. CAU 1675 TaxID=3032597 RepID=UPI0023D9B8B3|nr:RagB/SusD family nutrient uptake outer membrane protein [Algoriphagus sp. CAU 1675]MDF2157493.1 RagB/SusD family nutrient uptake outer membrane protein [Algoriphagus sp. CAU 1675]